MDLHFILASNHELKFLTNILYFGKLTKSPRTSIALSLHKEVNKSNKKIQSQQDAEVILHKFKDHKLLTNCKDTGAILLSTKFIFEMEAYIKENYPDLPECTRCEKEERGQKIIIRPIGVFHLHLLIFFFVYQFNSSIGPLVCSSFANNSSKGFQLNFSIISKFVCYGFCTKKM